MFDELKDYKNTGHFFFNPDENLADSCNAPKNASGVYLVFELAHGKINLIYIGSSGKMKNNGTITHQNGGLYGRIVSGIQFDRPRSKS
ncbi:MAG TPA: hypothetical protein VKM36_01870 [Balneolaceae bacterium]|nr:hypothetical protein [Balneolaceae bacterium]